MSLEFTSQGKVEDRSGLRGLSEPERALREMTGQAQHMRGLGRGKGRVLGMTERMRHMRGLRRGKRGVLGMTERKRGLRGMTERMHRMRGMTLVELILAFTILSLLATMAVPLTRYKVRRDKERQLRAALTEIRTAIDKYKDAADKGAFQVKQGTEGYPESLEILVEGTQTADASGTKIKFLRRIPKDPMTNSFDWGMRSVKDDPKSQSWGGDNVFDVYSKSYERARDGTPYSEW